MGTIFFGKELKREEHEFHSCRQDLP